MRVHHLNTLDSAPMLLSGRLRRGPIVAHCLLVETDDGLVLVDTGAGTGFVRAPHEMFGRVNRWMSRPVPDPDRPAARQLAALGFRPEDVRHVVLTHLDADHAGGIADFPAATVHVSEAEHRAAMRPGSRMEQYRYLGHLWRHEVRWARHATGPGEPWFGFETAPRGHGLPAGIVLVGLPGHTRGHLGVAVDAAGGWLLHAGDAYYRRGEIDPAAPPPALAARAINRVTPLDRPEHRGTQRRLGRLAREHPEVTVFSAHDAAEFAAAGRAGG